MQRSSDRVDTPPVRDWSSALLLFLLIQVAAARLVMTGWTPLLFITQTLSAFGTMLGLTLGYSRFSRQVIYLLMIAYSAVLIPWQLTGVVESDLGFGEKLASVGGRL